MVIAAVIELVDISALRRLYRVWTDRLGSIYGFAARADFAAAIAAMLGVLIFDTLPGLVIGIAVSMLLLLYRVSRPHVAGLAKRDGAWLDVDRHDDLRPDPRSVVVRVESGLFFANSDHVRERIEWLRTPETRIVVLDAETSPFIDITAAEMLAQLAADVAPGRHRAADRPGHRPVPGRHAQCGRRRRSTTGVPDHRRGAQRRNAARRRHDAARIATMTPPSA